MSLFPERGEFLQMFMNQRYRIDPLPNKGLDPNGAIYLPHDTDFDCELVLKTAESEAPKAFVHRSSF